MCRSMKVIQKLKHGILRGPQEFKFTDINGLTIELKQCGVRDIKITSNTDIDCDSLFNEFYKLNQLLMLFDGKLIPIDSILFFDENEENLNYSISIDYYESRDVFHGDNKLCEFEKVINKDIYHKWCSLLDDLDLIHKSFVFFTSSTPLPVDIAIAHIIEIFEPLVELITLQTGLFSSLKPGERGTTLKQCIDTIISHYGMDIFNKEYKDNSDKFLSALVYSRNRIMHIKRKTDNPLSPEECLLYIVKLSFLYRSVLLSLLGIPYSVYEHNLKNKVDKFNSWNNILDNFLIKLSKDLKS